MPQTTQPHPHATTARFDATQTAALLEVEQLTVRYGAAAPVLRDASFSVRAGEFVAVLGRSGAGKTTLLHTLAGMVKPQSGAVRWRSPKGAVCRAMLFQHYWLVPQLSVLKNTLCGSLGNYKWWQTLLGFADADQQRAQQLLGVVGLRDKSRRKVGRLSGGEQQRVAIARALMQQPDVLLADEPVAALDAETANEVMLLLQTLNQNNGMTVICSLHDLEMVERFATRALLLDQGRIVHDGAALDLQRVVRETLSWKTL
jgi:phosphonate transport system ATP-binding protein